MYILKGLTILNLVLALYYIKQKCIKNYEVEINHNLLFCLGFIYYWIFPMLLGIFNIYADVDNGGIRSWYNLFTSISEELLFFYLLFSLLFVCSFILGDYFADKFVRRKEISKEEKMSYKVLNIYLAVCVAFLIVYVYYFRDSFFAGYTSDASLSNEKGSFVAFSLVVFSLGLIYDVVKGNGISSEFNYKKICFNKFFIVYFLISFLILSLGGRLYFLSTIIMLFIYKSVYFNRILFRNILIGSSFIIIMMGAIGVIRLGGSIDGLVYNIILNIVMETMFTSFSMIGFLAAGIIDILNFPIVLLSSFVNLIPSVIFEDKASLIIDMETLGYTLFAPLGALNSFVSFMVNFGAIGSLIVIFFFGYLFSALKKRTNILCKIYYIMLSGWLPFTFFRDPFSVSLVKNMFEFSIVIPTLVYFSMYFFTSIQRRK